MGEALVEGTGGAGSQYAGDGCIRHTKPKIERDAPDIGGSYGKQPANDSGGSWEMGDVPLEELGGLEPNMRKRAVN